MEGHDVQLVEKCKLYQTLVVTASPYIIHKPHLVFELFYRYSLTQILSWPQNLSTGGWETGSVRLYC